MANEKRLIYANKAQAVLLNMAEHLMEAGNPEMAGAIGYAAEVIGKQRTVDAVEVVRCKDCKHCSHSGLCNLYLNVSHEMKPDDFCSYGKRREGNVE